MPSAILCSNDLTAIGVMNELAKAGHRVPEDVSVVGVDDIRFARLTRPPLTTIRIPKEALGRLAARTLEEMRTSTRPSGFERTIDTTLIIRDSTAGALEPAETPSATVSASAGVFV
jgi:DNA-binding LacI/PurR family transcriptional regulator